MSPVEGQFHKIYIQRHENVRWEAAWWQGVSVTEPNFPNFLLVLRLVSRAVDPDSHGTAFVFSSSKCVYKLWLFVVYYATVCYLTIRGGRVHVISPLKLRSYIGTCMSRTEKKVCSGGNSKPGTLSIPFFKHLERFFWIPNLHVFITSMLQRTGNMMALEPTFSVQMRKTV